MDSPETESNEAPQAEPSFKDRIAAHLKAEHGDDFTYDAPNAEPEGQPQEEAVAEASPEQAPDTEATDEPQSELEQPTEDGFEAVEVDGKEFKVPRELKDHLMRDKDYRQKTMELADTRKAVEQKGQAIEMAHVAMSQVAPLIAQLGVIDVQLQNLQRVDGQALYNNDRVEWMTWQQQLQNLSGARNQVVNGLGQAMNRVEQSKGLQFAQETARNVPLVQKHMPELNETRKQELVSFLKSGPLPLEDQDLAISRAGILYHLNRSLQLSKIEAERAKTVKQVSTAPPVNRSTQRTPVTGAQIELKKAEARLAKSGSSEDVMAVLAARRKARG